MYNNYNEFLHDCTNRIQSYISSSNIEKEEKEKIVSTFSRELLRFSIDSDGYKDFDVDYLIRSISVRVIDESLSVSQNNNDIGIEECNYIINLCKRQRDNMYQFENHKSWNLPSIKCDVDKIERFFINRKNDLENQKIKAEQDAANYKNLGRNYDGEMDDIRSDKKNEKSDFRSSVKKFFRITGLVCILILAIAVFGLITYVRNRIKFPYSPDYVYENEYQNIYESLAEAGYTNIECIEDTSGWKKENDIISFTVDGSSDFKKGAYYKPEAKIEIKYSSGNRIYLTSMLNNWQSANYEDVVKKLEYAGFESVNAEEIEVSDKSKDKSITSITLDGNTYTNEECYLYKKASIKIKYYRYKLKIGSNNNGFIGQDYNTVTKNIKNIGFTDVTTEEIKTGWAKGNSVVNVKVNDSTSYNSSDSFTENARIVVEYSSNDRIDVSSVMKNYADSSTDELKEALAGKGISNITIEKELTSERLKNQKIASVKINDDVFDGDSCYIQKNTKVVIRFYSLETTIDKTSDEIIGMDYTNAVNELKAKGFTSITLKRSDDLITGWKNKESTVKSITVNGSEAFGASDVYSYDVSIVIVVNTFKNKDYEGF